MFNFFKIMPTGFLLKFIFTLMAATLQPEILTRAQAQWRRYNVSSPEGQQMLKSYSIAVAALLKLAPDDPLNWYRIAFSHLLDCPHGNWWLFPWHRGYIGMVEQIVRQGNPTYNKLRDIVKITFLTETYEIQPMAPASGVWSTV